MPETLETDVLIVGAGHAGAQAAIALRQHGFDGTICLVGEEPELPYERPPLSKDYLAGAKPFERMLIRPAAFWLDRRVQLLPGRRALSIDASAHAVGLDDGGSIGYRTLVWAAGGHARRIGCPGHDLAGVHTVRSRADVDRIAAELDRARHVAVIGGGYIGLETAAVLSKLGKQVTVLEAQDRVLARVAGAALSRFYEAEHRAHGVEVRLGAAVECIEGVGRQATGVRLVTGERVPADLVIVGIGIVPAVEPLLTAGAAGGNGVWVDECCRSTLADVYAIGDCALHANAYAQGATIRLESVQNAHDMAACAAKAIVGRAEPYRAVPWFWSFQFDLHLQTVGLSVGHDDAVVRGDPAQRSFSVIYLKGGRVVALDCVNAAKDFVHGKVLVTGCSEVEPDRLADASISLKAMLPQTPPAVPVAPQG